MPQAEERDRSLHRHGDPDPSEWDEAQAVTGRDNDTPLRGEDTYAVPNTTFAERSKAKQSAETKAVQTAENKGVRAKRATRKRG